VGLPFDPGVLGRPACLDRQEALQPHLLYQCPLLPGPVDVALFHLEDVRQGLAGSLIIEFVAQADGGIVCAHGRRSASCVVPHHILDRFGQLQGVQLRDNRLALQEQDALDQPLGVMHLVDGLLLDRRVQARIPLVVAHLGRNHILADSGQFIGKQLVQNGRSFSLPFMGAPSRNADVVIIEKANRQGTYQVTCRRDVEKEVCAGGRMAWGQGGRTLGDGSRPAVGP